VCQFALAAMATKGLLAMSVAELFKALHGENIAYVGGCGSWADDIDRESKV